MREIKFRAVRLDTGEWIYGDLHLHTPFPHIHSTRGDKAKIDTKTIGQFTGLRDKNGKDIYEGDIVVQHWGSPHYRNGVYYDCNARIGSVEFHESGSFLLFSCGNLYRLLGDGLTQEVQGNIHDNPELLNRENK